MKNLIVLFIILFIVNLNSHSQEEKTGKSSLRTGIGLGFNEGLNETGAGLVYSFGYQKSLGKRNRLRLNPNMIIGGFLPIGITDVRDQFYRLTSLDLNLHYDLIKFRAVSLVTSPGVFLNYSRGLIGTGGWDNSGSNNSEYFNTLYLGGKFSFGLRIAPEGKRLAYEIRPLNIQFGNKGFLLGYLMFGIDIRLGNI